MRLAGKIILFIVFTLSSAVVANAGQLSGDLAEHIVGRSDSEQIHVWIKLPDVTNARLMKANLASAYATRAERHSVAIAELKSQHANSQSSLVDHLNSISLNALASSIKSHWISNIVEADVAIGQLESLAQRSDIETIYIAPKIRLVEPDRTSTVPSLSAGVESNLSYIRADEAWAIGFTGAGRIICSFDTGVDGIHPALFSNWKGHDGDSAAAWFDPKDNASFPHTLAGTSIDHGTHVMGTMIGHDDTTGDTIGVAPDAKWISAAVIDIAGVSILDAFEWAADPDGDPNSIDDVPDVINHSWGVPGAGCVDVFYSAIDNLEALGIVNIFAAGNEGPATMTIRNPANRALDSLDCFAVGNISSLSLPPTIAGSSSRGPTDCNGTIKPNVTAPGTFIRSSVLAGGYGGKTGTSMAAPHVSGLVALLRQKNPNATVDQIKNAILLGSNKFGFNLPDNNYGWGIIDCMGALDRLSDVNALPNVRVYSYDHAPINPGDVVSGLVVLENIGASVGSISATITSSDPSIAVQNGTTSFGTLNSGDTLSGAQAIVVTVSDTMTVGRVISLDFHITGTAGYSVMRKLHFLVEPAGERMIANHDINRIRFTITNFGTFGLGGNSFFPAGGVGFLVDASTNNEMFEAGIMVGRNSTSVSDGIRNISGEPDGDFGISPGGNLQVFQPGLSADQETFSKYDDSRSTNPQGISLIQQTYGYSAAVNDDFLILRYIVKNENPFFVSSIHLSLYTDWDPVVFTSNSGGWDATDSLLWTAYNNGVSLSTYRATRIIDGPITSAHTDRANVGYYQQGGDGLTEAEKWAQMTSGFTTANDWAVASFDLLQVLTAGPFNMNAGQIDTVAFAIVIGNTYADAVQAAQQALLVYEAQILNCCKVRGNLDGDLTGDVNIADVTYLVAYLFKGGPAPVCHEEGNVDNSGNGQINVSDLTRLIWTVWKGGPVMDACD